MSRTLFFLGISLTLVISCVREVKAQPGSSVGDIVITEIQYKPLKKRLLENLDPINGGYRWKTGEDLTGEYVEIHNRSTKSVDLSDWALDEGVCFKFPQWISLDSC